VNTLFEDPNLPDNPLKSEKKNRFGDPDLQNKYNYLLPEIHDSLKELRAELNQYSGHRVLIGETTDSRSIADLARMYGKNDDEIQLPMNFMFAYINKLSAPEFRKHIAEADNNPAKGWPVYLFSNHDERRAYDRYGDGKNNDAIAKILATMLYTLRGTPILYYGEELGMKNNDPTRVEDVKDPIGKLGWPKEKGRDGERTPMPWTAGKNGGFSDVQPWLPVGEQYKTHNVESESKDPNSVLSFYRALAALRSKNAALREGEYVALNESDPNVLSYLRKAKDGSAVLVSLNMSETEQTVKFDLGAKGISATQANTLLSTGNDPTKSVPLSAVKLAPYSVYIGEL
jgi:alpha-glucosidase